MKATASNSCRYILKLKTKNIFNLIIITLLIGIVRVKYEFSKANSDANSMLNIDSNQYFINISQLLGVAEPNW